VVESREWSFGWNLGGDCFGSWHDGGSHLFAKSFDCIFVNLAHVTNGLFEPSDFYFVIDD
jgi:hypothetical protein